MALPENKSIALGFLTVREVENTGLRGGYLLTTEYGRPLEFHYTSVLHISKLQRMLHGSTFEAHVYTEVMGIPLTERQTKPPQIIFVDHPALLELRQHIPAPVVLWEKDATSVRAHASFPQDVAAFEKLRTFLPVSLDLAEPYLRIEQAFQELREPISALAA